MGAGSGAPGPDLALTDPPLLMAVKRNTGNLGRNDA